MTIHQEQEIILKKTNKKQVFKDFYQNIFSIKTSPEREHKILKVLGIKFKIKIETKRIDENNEFDKFVKFIEDGFKTNYVDYITYPKLKEDALKPIAFYLPQFHSFKENEEWYGKGFTEWTNVTKAIPQFVGHYQPRLPIDVSFYNLNNNDVFYRQIELAKNYGIHGFSFYYYWFSGRKLMEKPIYNYLNDKNLDFPFCLCWACENWSKLWDGGNKELLVESKLSQDDFEQFWADILPFFEDERYIKINNKPLLIIYRPNIFDSEVLKKFISFLRQKAKDTKFGEIYLSLVITGDLTGKCDSVDIKEHGFDALVEFPPHGLCTNKKVEKRCKIIKNVGYLNSNFKGLVLDIKSWIEEKKWKKPLFDNNVYRGIFPSWDNSARKARTGCWVFYGETPELYKQWLEGIARWTRKNRPKNEQYIFINAWNEWAEGAHLEPDYKYGYAYLQATREVLEKE